MSVLETEGVAGWTATAQPAKTEGEGPIDSRKEKTEWQFNLSQ